MATAERSAERLAYEREYYRANRERILARVAAYQREHLAEHNAATARHRKKDLKATRAYHRAYYRAHLDELREAGAAATRKHRLGGRKQAPPTQRSAHHAVRKALAAGEITKPTTCTACGAPTPSRRLHAHHADYSKPLEIRWLCAFCHKAVHMGA